MMLRFEVWAAWLLLGACNSGIPSYHGEIAELLDRYCVDCHRPDGVAPVPSLDSKDMATKWAAAIKLMAQNRAMPPSGIDGSGFCGEFVDAPTLSRSEIERLSLWADGGAPSGSPAQRRSGTPASARFVASGVVLDQGGPFTPDLGVEGTRCFVADPGLAAERWLSAIRVGPRTARSIARVSLFALDSEETERGFIELDRSDPRPGYACFGAPHDPSVRMLARWSWGTPVRRLPGAVQLLPGRKVLLQVHYNVIPSGLGVPVQTRVELEFDPGAPRAEVDVLRIERLELPGRRSYVEARHRFVIRRAGWLVGVAAEMHTAGKALQLRVIRGTSSRCLASFDHWKVFTQQTFTSRQPVALVAGDELLVTCAYNTQSRAEVTVAGERIDQEDCAAYLYLNRASAVP
jgi:Copper type II ascorbate-dependent monooxygenase, C-terminal domain